MKKYIALALGLLFILGFTATAFAIHIPDLPPDEQIVTSKGSEIKLGGRIMVRGWYFSGANFSGTVGNVPSSPTAASIRGLQTTHSSNTNAVPGSVPAIDDVTQREYTKDAEDAALWTTNIALTLDAKISDNVQGFIELEVSQGENVQSGLYIWGGGPSAFQGHDSKPNADLRFRQAWILYTGSGLLGAPAGVKVGHQLITLGEKQFLNHERFGDDALIVFVNPMKELHLAAATVKANEGAYTLPGDDLDVYALIGTYKLNKDNTAGINYALFKNSNIETTLGYANLDELNFQNLGLHANGMLAGMFDYAVEFDTQFGKAKGFENGSTDHPLGTDDFKFRGFAVYMKGGYKIPDTPLNLRASLAYGSGDGDGLENHEIGEFQVSQGFDSEIAIARFVHYTQIYERTIATAALLQTLGGNGAIVGPHRNTGIANTTYYNLGLDLAATKDLSLSLDGFLLRATKTGGWENTLDPTGALGIEVSKNLGWEIDFKGSYKLAKNLTYFIEAGSFAAGAFYEDTNFVLDKGSVTQVIHGLNLTF